VQFSPSLIRANLEELSAFIGKGPELAYVRDNVLETASHNISVRIYSAAPKKKLPVVLHFHGGGHMCGSVDLYDAISRKIAQAGHCVVIAVEYRLAPEHPFPAGVDDCQFSLLHYKTLLTDVNYNDQLIILGDSAGGAICTTLASRNLTDSNVTIDKQILIYPSVDYTMTSASIKENGSGFLLEEDKIAWYFEQYLQGLSFQRSEDIINMKLASPLYMAITEDMPQTLIFTAGCDPLRDEGIAYCEALKRMNVSVEHHVFDGMIHAFMLLDSLVASECQKTYQLIGDFIRK
jgi:acetyl esterase/lipase